MGISKFNVTLDNGFVKENEMANDLSRHAKAILENLLSVTKGDLAQTAKLLDAILNETQTKIKKLTEEENISDSEFYEKLSQLRKNHKETLEIVEHLYLGSETLVDKTDKQEDGVTNNPEKPDLKISNDKKRASENDEPSSYPPLSIGSMEVGAAINPISEFRQYSSLKYSDDNRLNARSTSSEKANDCMNRGDAQFCGSTSSEWRHHITIPKPFNMSKREELKRQGACTSCTSCRLQDGKQKIEHPTREGECGGPGRFRAQPIPAHVYLPRYEQITEENARRREAVRAHSQDILKETEKPFRFTLREKFRNDRSAQSIEKVRFQTEKEKKGKLAIRARQKEISKVISESLDDRVLQPRKVIDAMTEQRKQTLMHQDADYQRELEEMRKRVASKPLLITRQSQEVARKRAEAKFNSALRRAGIDPQDIINPSYDRPSSFGVSARHQNYEELHRREN
ncbi:hypothetical protein CRM22_004668 [Opisthorchis felineus]|uniref:Uncharacterized protein n=1 Tax=Opisthorchis felineus TaxID=147828 RepID=A0A4S2LV16_OPIFE|nr:hypothetical protein CRM22_004668 [Opisthorchis felineus]